MCGIFFSCSENVPELPSTKHFDILRRRGPDNVGMRSQTITFEPTTNQKPPQKQNCILTFLSTVLSLRGDTTVAQPLEDPKSGSLLCWNGEAWKAKNEIVQGNDAEVVFNLLLNATQTYNSNVSNGSSTNEQTLRYFINAIGDITGPYAFVFYDAQTHRVFYGRDPLGRRSLLVKRNPSGGIVISSLPAPAEPHGWTEVEADGVNMLDLQGRLVSLERKSEMVTHIPWVTIGSKSDMASSLRYPLPALNKDYHAINNTILNVGSPAVSQLFDSLRASVSIRTHNIPTPPSQTAALSRVAVLFSGGIDCTLIARLIHDIIPREQQIDLLNVAFENPRVFQALAARSIQAPSALPSAYALCPDRITGRSSHAELRKICPGRAWCFVSIDVPYIEMQAHRSQIIDLIRPHNTEMDLSISCALYFAARGSGIITDESSDSDHFYTSPARVLLSGLGADELFGGYTRHATAFEHRGHMGLADELELDFNRLGKRNLGRDDRVISHWGKEARYPYLDEDVVSWALRVPVWEKCGFGQYSCQAGDDAQALEPGKKVLRLLAWRLGLKVAAAEKKRAIQFGARTAKMEAGKTRGTQLLR